MYLSLLSVSVTVKKCDCSFSVKIKVLNFKMKLVGIFKIQQNSWISNYFKIHKIRILDLWLIRWRSWLVAGSLWQWGGWAFWLVSLTGRRDPGGEMTVQYRGTWRPRPRRAVRGGWCRKLKLMWNWQRAGRPRTLDAPVAKRAIQRDSCLYRCLFVCVSPSFVRSVDIAGPEVVAFAQSFTQCASASCSYCPQ